MEYELIRFIDEPIEVQFEKPPVFEKVPHCPNLVVWDSQVFKVEMLLSEWQDFRRRGRMARNMAPTHALHAAIKGSWGVGKYYFRVQTDSGRIFDIYYDRAPSDFQDRKGNWFILAERRITD
jgi:hypothetical protein